MNIKDLIIYGEERLKDLEYVDGKKEAIYILSKVLDRDVSYIFTNLDIYLPSEVREEYKDIINKRSRSYPTSYIFNEKSFYDLDLFVEEGVLIPRFETEILVDYIIGYIRENYTGQVDILEIGSGSGAISLSLAKHCKNASVLGVDISDKALEVSNYNKNKLEVENVSFIKSDLFESIEDNKRFDIIVSNPPYIESRDLKSLQKDVKMYEPSLALDGGREGLDFYEAITIESTDYIRRRGLLIYEIGYKQAESVRQIMKENEYKDIEVIKDLQNHDRIVRGIKK